VAIAGVTLPRIAGRLESLAEQVLWRVNASVTGL
jgi:hypothetical protein